MRGCYLTDDARQRGREKIAAIQKQQYESRLAAYAAAPKRCANCNVAIAYEKRQNDYCSRSCAATVNNRGVRRNVTEGTWAKKSCPICGKETKQKCCSRECSKTQWETERQSQIESTGSLVNYKHDKRYLIETRGHKCEQCFTERWQGVAVPLVLDHIDGNSDNNLLTNVRLLCHNCNALTPTFCGKNIGNGRSRRKAYRNERYANGKSY